ncbi:hypothetical protein ACH5RR_027845 [Cinchona calisaya]|uniref:GDSL esterase/lipase n=1 Tax=Cinchona calisaya TaxID=153742 RepID=A0ABD2YP33_9GENT
MAKHAIPLLILIRTMLEILRISAAVPSIIVFGDSSVDSGNNNYVSTIVKSNFEPYGRDYKDGRPTGRFSNGRIFTDFISEAFGIKPTVPAYLDPTYNITEFTTGVSFASAGSGYDNVTSDVFSVIPLWKELKYYKEYQWQLKNYLGKKEAERFLSEALYMISSGTNDFVENYYMLPVRASEYSIEEFQNFLVGIARSFIMELYQLGGRKISLAGLPPIGCLPMERNTNLMLGGGCIESYNSLAKEFNQKLQALVEKLNKEQVGIQLVFSNSYGIFSDIIQNPNAFGFENTATACCGTGTFEMSYACDRYNPFTCKDANKYVFWDAFHATQKTNGIVADHAVKNSLAVFR